MKKATTKYELNNDHEGHGYTIPKNTTVEVLRIQHGKAIIRGPGLDYTPTTSRKTTVVIRADLSDLELEP